MSMPAGRPEGGHEDPGGADVLPEVGRLRVESDHAWFIHAKPLAPSKALPMGAALGRPVARRVEAAWR